MSGTDTLLLDRNLWDLCKDAAGNIALASKPYATAQDVASSVRTFSGEVYYDTERGVPYLTQVFTSETPIQLAKEQIIAAATLVPDVQSAQVFIQSVDGRTLTGQVSFIDGAGNTQTLGLT